jgi:hypothetical protein
VQVTELQQCTPGLHQGVCLTLCRTPLLQAFNNFLDAKIDESPMASLLIFPEGEARRCSAALTVLGWLAVILHSRHRGPHCCVRRC